MKYIALLLILAFVSCKNETATPKPDAGNDTIVITGKCAVVYSLPPEKQELLKQKWGREQFDAKIDSASYYMSEAKFHIDTAKIKVVDAKGKRVLKFVKNRQQDYIVNLDTVQHLMGIYLFDPPKSPKQVNMYDVVNSIQKYYSGNP